jgi:hypothetical protein
MGDGTAVLSPGLDLRFLACTQLTPKASVDPCETEKLRAAFEVPMEMR